ncbi:homocysteine S-methyltransferase 1-like [Cucumis melo var. makuwa]|uniref:Homocysteine S-methyltransferase 1-like n=1 Tax=Cucumis melo var. makuwa TaxID=1194695 RepID=A0A5A7T5P3_CUCMM|nr:homocysteine S-methyltransferase 1-like [Cucumis melo var. makuwa]TYK01942.1 homocysteine S-methyltransferase 1-like [Cucumis melo var. makuwa]
MPVRFTVKSRGMLKRCAFLYTLWRCHSSQELCHTIKPDDCYLSIGHNYNRALVAASIGSYGAYLADGSEYRLALLLVVLILAHELEVVEDAECKFI